MLSRAFDRVSLHRSRRVVLWLLATPVLMIASLSGAPIEPVATARAADAAASLTSRILLNQAGYPQYGPKTAFIANRAAAPTGSWEIVRLEDDSVVLDGSIERSDVDPFTGHHMVAIDFSLLTDEGQYVLRSGEVQSTRFSIKSEPYGPLLQDLFRSYYLQRCGAPIDDIITGIKRPACHLDDARYAHDDLVDPHHNHHNTIGGWHDAGDYGKYVATTAITVTEILSRYEQFPLVMGARRLDIPESGDDVPDVLDEMRIGIDWLLAMQRKDGALYRKLSGKAWPKLVSPEEDRQRRYLYGPSTSDTAKAVATFAIAARLYARYDQEAAKQLLTAARRGWQYLGTHGEMHFDYRDGDDSGSGPYRANKTDLEPSLRHDRDDRLAAALELYLTTGEIEFLTHVRHALPGHRLTLYEWKDPATQSLINFLWHPKSAQHEQLRSRIRGMLLTRAREALVRASTNQWRVANTRFIWGSNKMAAEEGVLLMQGWRLTGHTSYLNAAIDQLDYLLGRNPNNQSYVTGAAAGERSIKNIAHIYVRATGKLIPGLLVGGPNEKAQAKIAPPDQGPMSYVDDARSYATNEYAIDYTSALIALLVDLNQAESTLYESDSTIQSR